MKTQNITLKVPIESLQKAKAMAAHRGTSLSALLAQKLQEAIGEEAGYDAARKRAFKGLEAGWHLGGLAFARDVLRG